MQPKIMLVDDDAAIVQTLGYLLLTAGFEVVSLNDGETALTKARAEEPSLILLDLMLPGISGLETCKALKEDVTTRHIPIIMLTGKKTEGDKIIGFELGADDYITKPFSPRELLLRIQRSLGVEGPLDSGAARF